MEFLDIAFALFWVWIGRTLLGFDRELNSDWRVVQGTMVGHATARQSRPNQNFYYKVFEFIGSDGSKRYLQSGFGYPTVQGDLGEVVEIWVHKTNPQLALVKLNFIRRMGLGSIGIGVIVFGACLLSSALNVPRLIAAVFVAAIVSLRIFAKTAPGKVGAARQGSWREKFERAISAYVFTEETKSQMEWVGPVPGAQRPAVVSDSPRASGAPTKSAWGRLISLVLGGALLVSAAIFYQRTFNFIQQAERTSGLVVELITNRGKSTTYTPVVEFVQAGKTVRFKDFFSSNPPSFRVGDRVTVLLKPSHPEDARIDHGLWNYWPSYALGGFGLLIFVSGLIGQGLRSSRRRSDYRPPMRRAS